MLSIAGYDKRKNFDGLLTRRQKREKTGGKVFCLIWQRRVLVIERKLCYNVIEGYLTINGIDFPLTW